MNKSEIGSSSAVVRWSIAWLASWADQRKISHILRLYIVYIFLVIPSQTMAYLADQEKPGASLQTTLCQIH